jgi:hypothetical protein
MPTIRIAVASTPLTATLIAPDGTLVAQVPYGRVGVTAAEVDLSRADGFLARRWAPERNRLADPHLVE